VIQTYSVLRWRASGRPSRTTSAGASSGCSGRSAGTAADHQDVEVAVGAAAPGVAALSRSELTRGRHHGASSP